MNDVHGNSLKSTRTNYGYILVYEYDNILKFGESVNPQMRYTKKYLERNHYKMKVLVSGSKKDIHYWQFDMNNYYLQKYSQYPPLIKSKRDW